jgi:transcriptional enhancer factor
MFVQQKDMPNVVRRLHTYTASIAQPNSPDENLHDWPTVSSAYPQLAKLHSERPLNCNIVAAQASIALTTETWKDQKNVELGISFSCRSHHLPVDAKISCWNRFYKDGSYVNDGCRPDEVQLLQNEQGRMEAQVKFGSKFWASNLACLATRLRNGIDPMTGSSNSREEVRRLIDGITATQEIVAQTEHGGAETLLVIFWKFKLSSGSQGQASWHRLLLPSVSAAHYNESSQDESLDSFMYNLPYDYASPSQQIQPGLQSPFEYEQDSSSGSALTSGTWPASLDDGINTAPANAVDFTGDNSLDFTGGSINVSYDDTNFDFSNFDSTAFSLDTAGDFVTDPILEQYSQPDYSTQYCDSYANSFDTQQSISASDASFAISAMDSQSQNVFEGFGEPYGHSFSVGNESQAYGGAGEEMIKEEDPLAALADASYMVSGALTREEHRSQE